MTRVEVLLAHQWTVSRWGDGRGGYSWDCTCGIHAWGTEAENPKRYQRLTRDAAEREAAGHVVAVLDGVA